MPEISQDAFEALNPGLPPVTPQELRSRANSSGSRNTKTKVSFEDAAKAAKIGSDSASGSGRTRTMTISEAELDTFHQFQQSADHLYGYKREIAHRYFL